MSGDGTSKMLQRYEDGLTPPGFLSSLFQTTERSFHSAEKVELDVIRNEPRLAIPLPSIKAGARKVEANKYVNKSYEPPVYDLETSISSYNGLKRRAGRDPFEDPQFLRDAGDEAFRIMRVLEGMIRAANELMCAQILQTGKIVSIDESGTVIYDLDFVPKPTHFVTVGVPWAIDGLTGAPLADIDNLAQVIRQDGKGDPDQLIFGRSALQRFLANKDVVAKLDNRRMELGMIQPAAAGNGATRHGRVWVGDYEFEIWSYKNEYIHPQTGVLTPYINTDSVIVRASNGRMDQTFGAIPMFVPPEARAAQFLPPLLSSVKGGMALSTNAWVTPDGKHLSFSVGTRPLPMPTAIDTFGCLDVIP